MYFPTSMESVPGASSMPSLKANATLDVLWESRDYRCKATKETFMAAIQGDWREEYLFVLKQCFEEYQHIKAKIAECDEQIAIACAKISSVVDDDQPLPPAAKKSQHILAKNTPGFSVYHEGWRLWGTDMSDIDGFSGSTLVSLMSELGNKEQILSAFTSADRFVSWLSVCPDNHKTGGKIYRTKTRKNDNRVARAFRLAAYGLDKNSNSEMGKYCRKMKGRLGKAEGITATAHKLARVFYSLLVSGEAYDEKKAFPKTKAQVKRQLRNLEKNAEKLGYKLVPVETENQGVMA